MLLREEVWTSKLPKMAVSLSVKQFTFSERSSHKKKNGNSSWDVWLPRLQFPCFSTHVEYFLQHFPKTSPSGKRLLWRGKRLSKQEKDYKPCSTTRPRSKLLEVQILAKIISTQFFMNVKARIEFLYFPFFYPTFLSKIFINLKAAITTWENSMPNINK